MAMVFHARVHLSTGQRAPVAAPGSRAASRGAAALRARGTLPVRARRLLPARAENADGQGPATRAETGMQMIRAGAGLLAVSASTLLSDLGIPGAVADALSSVDFADANVTAAAGAAAVGAAAWQARAAVASRILTAQCGVPIAVRRLGVSSQGLVLRGVEVGDAGGMVIGTVILRCKLSELGEQADRFFAGRPIVLDEVTLKNFSGQASAQRVVEIFRQARDQDLAFRQLELAGIRHDMTPKDVVAAVKKAEEVARARIQSVILPGPRAAGSAASASAALASASASARGPAPSRRAAASAGRGGGPGGGGGAGGAAASLSATLSDAARGAGAGGGGGQSQPKRNIVLSGAPPALAALLGLRPPKVEGGEQGQVAVMVQQGAALAEWAQGQVSAYAAQLTASGRSWAGEELSAALSLVDNLVQMDAGGKFLEDRDRLAKILDVLQPGRGLIERLATRGDILRDIVESRVLGKLIDSGVVDGLLDRTDLLTKMLDSRVLDGMVESGVLAALADRAWLMKHMVEGGNMEVLIDTKLMPALLTGE